MSCSKCQSDLTIKYGHAHYGKKRFQYLDCRRQFVENPTRQPIDDPTRKLTDRLLLFRLALAAIALLDWMHDALLYFPKSIGTIGRWFGEIVGYFYHRTTSGTVEGINNNLKLIKRLGYGFRNLDNFRLRSLLSWHFSINLT